MDSAVKKRIAARLLILAPLLSGILLLTMEGFRHTPPAFSYSGLLGITNIIIVTFLLGLTTRHFVLLLFSSFEQVRRTTTRPSGNLAAVSVIVPAYNEAKVIADTVRHLKQIQYDAIEFIIIDDGSADNTAEVARAAAGGDTRFRVYRKTNGGKSTALNFGIAKAAYDYVFCMDADSHVTPDAIRHGMNRLASSGATAVAGSVRVLNSRQWLGRFQALEYLTGLNLFKLAQSYLGLITVIPGPSGLFRKSALQDLGGYHSDTFAEDCDLTLRLVMAGHIVIYEPLMEVLTEAPDRISDLIKQRYRWNRGILQATRKHLRQWPDIIRSPHKLVLILYLSLETLFLPVMNLAVAVLSMLYIGYFQDFSLVSGWLIQLTLLELTAILYTLTDPRWPASLSLLALVNRFTYAFFLDIIKIFASVEEFSGIRMSWGKLDRIGAGKT